MGLVTGKVAIVTGGSGGIGRAVCLDLAREGGRVVVHYHHNRQAAEAVVEEIVRSEGEAFGIQADVSTLKDVRAMVSETLRRFGTIDILVNTAGISPKKNGRRLPVAEMEEKNWDEVLDTNLKSTFLCSQAVMEIMKKKRAGKIVNMSSIVGKTGSSGPAGGHYAASKGGIIAFSKSLAWELAPYGINVNTVAPGWITTELTGAVEPEEVKPLLDQIPLGRAGKPEEVAKVISFLASDGANYIIGATIDINGGWLMD